MTEHPWRVSVVARAMHPPRVTHRLTRDTTTHVLGVSRPHPTPRPPLHSRLAQMPSTGTTAASTTTSAAAARARPRVRCGRCVGARVVVTACLVLLFSGSASRVAGVVLVAAAASRRPPTRATCATRMPAPWSTRSACRVWNPARRAPRQTTHACAPRALFPASASRSAALVRMSAPVQAPSQLRVRDACDVDTAPEASGCGAAAQPSLAGRGRGGRRRPPLSSSPSSWRSSVRHRDDAAPRDVDNDCGYAAVLLCRTVCLSRKVQGFYHSTAPSRSRRIRSRKWGLVGPSPPRENPLIMKYTLASGATNEATTIVTRNLDHNNPPDD